MMPLRAHLTIKLPYDISVALKKALKPDNEVPPKGFEIKEFIDYEGFHLIVSFNGKVTPVEILTTLSVIDEVTQLARSLANSILKATTANSYKPSIAKEE